MSLIKQNIGCTALLIIWLKPTNYIPTVYATLQIAISLELLNRTLTRLKTKESE